MSERLYEFYYVLESLIEQELRTLPFSMPIKLWNKCHMFQKNSHIFSIKCKKHSCVQTHKHTCLHQNILNHPNFKGLNWDIELYLLPIFLIFLLVYTSSVFSIYCIKIFPKTTHIYYLAIPIHQLSWALPLRTSYNEAIKVSGERSSPKLTYLLLAGVGSSQVGGLRTSVPYQLFTRGLH